MAKLKVGMVGIGRATAYGKLFTESPLTEVTALCDFNEEKLAQSAADFSLSDKQVFTKYDDFLNADMDIVVLGTPMPYHAEQVVKGLAAEKNWGVYKNLNGNLTINNCEFNNYNNAICGVNNGNGSTTVITGCTFININGEAIGYVASSMPAEFETEVIANNTGLTAANVIGY